jgi:hypothetical protein
MMFLLNDDDLGIVIAPAVVMTARPPTMKAAIVMAVFRQTRSSKLFSEASFRLEASLRRPRRAMSALGHYGSTVGTFLSARSLVSKPRRRA